MTNAKGMMFRWPWLFLLIFFPGALMAMPGNPPQATEKPLPATLIFIDPAVQDYQILAAAIQEPAEIIILAPSGGLEQITATLATRRNISALHIISHGRAGELFLGEQRLSRDNLSRHASELRSWSHALAHGADILLYGCDIAQNTTGTDFLLRLARLTGADIAASTTPTGSPGSGADWKLETTVGQVETASIIPEDTPFAETLAGNAPSNIVFGTPSLPCVIAAGQNVVTPLGNLSTVTNTDDGYQEIDISDIIEDGLNFFGTTYVSLHIGSNGYITFGHGNSGYSPAGISGYTTGPLIAAQFDDIHPGKGGNIYYSLDDDNDTVSVTWQNVAAFSSPKVGSGTNTFQIILHGMGSGDFAIEIRYERMDWIQSGNIGAYPTAGWTAGDQTNYGTVTNSGTTNLVDVESQSNIDQPGVFLWEVRGGGVGEISVNVPENAAAGTVVAPLSADDPDTDASALTFTLVDDDNGNFEIIQDEGIYKVTVKEGANLDYETSPSHQRTIRVRVADPQGNQGENDLAIPLTDANDAPVLDDDLSLALTTIAEDTTDPAGTTIADLLPEGAVSDPDGAAAEAIAVTTVDTSHGTWQFSTNSGGSWSDLGLVSPSSARLLADTDRLRFVPAPEWNGTATITLRAWDTSSGDRGLTADTTNGSSAFSTATDEASLTVTPVYDPPVVISPSNQPPGPASTILGGTISEIGDLPVTERGVFWSTDQDFADQTGTKVSETGSWSETGPFTMDVSGLPPGTTIHYQLFASTSAGTFTGGRSSFLTLCAAPQTPAISTITASGFTAGWDAVNGAAGYRLDLSTAADFSSFVSGHENREVNDTTLIISGLEPGTAYHLRVRAVNAEGTGASSATADTITICSAPANPAVSAITTAGFTTGWDAVTGASAYRLDLSTAPDFNSFVTGYENRPVNATTLAVSGLEAGSTYYWRARAENASGASASSTVSATHTICTMPAGLNVSAITTAGFSADWDAVSGATGYRLDLSTSADFSSFVSGYEDRPLSTTTLAVSGLEPGSTYYWRTRAENASGAGASSTVFTMHTLCATPRDPDVSGITATGFTAGWNAVTGATGYRLDLSTAADFSSFVSGYENRAVDATTMAISGLEAGTTYHWRVRADNPSGSSLSSVTRDFITLCDAPSTLSAVHVDETEFTARWLPATGAASYRLDVSSSADFNSPVSGYEDLTVDGTNQNVSGLHYGQAYYYRVRAVNASGTSADSAPRTVSTPNTLTISGPGTYEIPAGTSADALVISGGATVTAAGPFTVNGTLTITGGTFEIPSGTSADALVISGGATVDAGGPVDINGPLTITDGTFTPWNDSSFDDITIAEDGTFQPADGALITVNGDFTNRGTFNHADGTIIFSGDTDQTITSGGDPFHRLTVNTGGTLSTSDPVTVTDALAINDGTFTPLNGSSFADITIAEDGTFKPADAALITLTGDFTNVGTFNHAGGAMVLAGDTDQSVTTGGDPFNRLRVDNEGHTVTVTDDLALADNLVITAGILEVNGGIDASGDLTVNDTLLVTRDVNCRGLTIDTDGLLETLTGDLNATGSIINAGSLTVAGQIAAGGDLTNTGTLSTALTPAAGGNLDDNGDIVVDAPVAVMTDAPEGLTSRTDHSIAVSGLGVTAYRFRIDNGPWQNHRSVNEALAFAVTDEGAHSLEVLGRNHGGAWQPLDEVTRARWTLDTTPPEELTLTGCPSGTVGADQCAIALAGATLYRYRMDYGGWSPATPTTQVLTLSDLAPGEHTLEIIAADKAGNWTETAISRTWTVDPAVPTAILANLPAAASGNNSATIIVSKTGVAAYAWQLDDGVWYEDTADTPIELDGLDEGMHTLRVNARGDNGIWQDGADGRTAEAATTWTWRVDTSPVEVINDLVARPGNPDTTTAELAWSWDTPDEHESVRRYRLWYGEENVSADGNATELFCALRPQPAGHTETHTVTGLTPGLTYYFAVQTVDAAGNVSALSDSASCTLATRLPAITAVSGIETSVDNSTPHRFTLSGENFAPASGANIVRLYNKMHSFNLVPEQATATTLDVRLPAGAPAGTYRLRVINRYGASAPAGDTLTLAMAADPLPEIHSIQPALATASQSHVLTITGRHLTDASRVVFVNEEGTEFAVEAPYAVTDENLTLTLPDTLPAGIYDLRVVCSDGDSNMLSAERFELAAPLDLSTETAPLTTSTIVATDAGAFPVDTTLTTATRPEVDAACDKEARIAITFDAGTILEEEQEDAWQDYAGPVNPPRQIPPDKQLRDELGEDCVVFAMGAEHLIRLKNGRLLFARITLDLPAEALPPVIYYVAPDGTLEIAGTDGTHEGLAIKQGGTVLETRHDTPEADRTTYTVGLLLEHMSTYAAGVQAEDEEESPAADTHDDDWHHENCFISAVSLTLPLLPLGLLTVLAGFLRKKGR